MARTKEPFDVTTTFKLPAASQKYILSSDTNSMLQVIGELEDCERSGVVGRVTVLPLGQRRH
jgi:hypothetical protein